jgi:hypothetical protein
MSSFEDRRKNKVGVPFYSQHKECLGEELVGNIACAPTCFKMCLEFFRIFPKMSVLEMYKYGLQMKGKTEAGFKHDFIVEEFKRTGLSVRRFDKYGEYKREDSEVNKIKIDPWTCRASKDHLIWAAGDCSNILYHQNNIASGEAVKALEDIYKTLKTK